MHRHRQGRMRKVLMQAPTNGFFYVIDRETSKLISAEKIGKVTWAERINLKTGRPVEAPGIRYPDGPATIWPSTYGAHNWQAMSYNPNTGRASLTAILRQGLLASRGMPKFSELNDDDITSLQQYVLSRARIVKDRGDLR